MKNNPLLRLDQSSQIKEKLLPYCRLQLGDVWIDPVRGHRVGCLDAANKEHIETIMAGESARLAIHDPPLELVTFGLIFNRYFIEWKKMYLVVLLKSPSSALIELFEQAQLPTI